MTEQEQLIADQADLEAFARLPAGQRQVTNRLRGVLAETAVTGVIRYPWPLLQPLVAHLMQEQLAKYEAEEHVEIGPARPILDSSDDSVQQLSERFSKMLSGFDSHPWTLQRLCEVLLEPQKQYKRLHKLALAIEKLLLVTGELSTSEQPGPPPALGQLTRINEAPPPPAGAAGGSNAANRSGDSDGSGLIAAALDVRQQPQQAAAAAPTAEANAVGDPQPAAAAAGDAGGAAVSDLMQVDPPAAATEAATGAAGVGERAPAAAAAASVPAAGAADADAGGDTAMETEPPAATAPAAASTTAPSAAPASAAADTEMATEVPAVTDHSYTNAVEGAAAPAEPAST